MFLLAGSEVSFLLFHIVDSALNLGVNLIEGLVDVVTGRGVVLVQRGCHGTVAFPERVDVTEWDGQHNSVVEHICHIQIEVGIWNHKQVVGLVVIVIAIFHGDVVSGVNLMVERVETTVAGNLKHAPAGEGAVVAVILLYKVEMHMHISRYDIRILHIFEELCATFKILLILPVFQRRKLNLIL